MQYEIDYQFLAKGASRPQDEGVIVGIKATDKSGLVILPNVGDYVKIDNSMSKDGRDSFEGKVRSRTFLYTQLSTDMFCRVNIIVEETEDDWGKLLKE